MPGTSTPSKNKKTPNKNTNAARLGDLIKAIESRDLPTIKKLMSNMSLKELCTPFVYKCQKTVDNAYFNVSKNTPMKITPLGYAVLSGPMTFVREVSKKKPGVVKCTVPKGVYSPLKLALMFGMKNTMEYLVSENAPIGDVLHDAVSLDNIPFVKILIRSGVNMNKKSERDSTSLLESAKSFGMVTTLVEAGANVNARNSSGVVGGTPLMSFIWFERYGYLFDGVKYLIDSGTSLTRTGTFKNVSGINVLHALAMSRKVFTPQGNKTLRLICDAFSKHNISLNQKTSENKTALEYMVDQYFEEYRPHVFEKGKKSVTSNIHTSIQANRRLERDQWKLGRYHVLPFAMENTIALFIHLGAQFKHIVLPGNRKTTLVDYIIMSNHKSIEVCKLFSGKTPVKLTDTAFPFHILVFLVMNDPCYDALFTKTRLRNTVQHLIRSGFDINACVQVKNNGATVYKESSEAPIHKPALCILEKELWGRKLHTSTRTKRKQRLVDLHSLYVSVGAQRTKGLSKQVTRREKRKDHVTKWTSNVYQNIQNYRRASPTSKPEVHENTNRVNRYLAQVMRNTSIRAPTVPRGFENVGYLYRGVHGPIAKALRKSGEYKDKGYIAFSRSQNVANGFGSSKGGFTLRIPIHSIPRGTPWLWFKRPVSSTKNKNIHDSIINENEVLLPPGTLRIDNGKIPRGKKTNIDISYTPNRNATSIKGTSLYRKA